MADPRAECWLAAQRSLEAADEIVARLKLTPATPASEVPAVLTLNMARAQILATLATAPYDVLVAVERVARMCEAERIKRGNDINEFLTKQKKDSSP